MGECLLTLSAFCVAMVVGFIVYPTYTVVDDAPVVQLVGRLENGETFRADIAQEPFFYIRTEDVEVAKQVTELSVKKTDFVTFANEPVSRVTVRIPKDVPSLRRELEDAGIRCFEADIRFAYRFLIDNSLTGAVRIEGEYEQGALVDRVYTQPKVLPAEWDPQLSVLSLDIETNKRAGELWSVCLATRERSERLIVHKQEVAHAHVCPSEKELLKKLSLLIKDIDPDIITGWNVIDFDLKVLQEKYRQYELPWEWGRLARPNSLRVMSEFFRDSTADIPGRVVLDGIQLLRSSFIRLDSYSLEDAAQEYLDEGKLFTGKDRYEQIADAYNNDPEQLLAYNLKDCELVLDILDESGVLGLTIKRSLLTGMPLDRVKASIASLDMLYLPRLHKRGVVAPTSGYVQKNEPITGGFVMESQPGVYDYVIVCDFKSLYPSIIRSLNIDPWAFKPDVSVGESDDRFVVAENGAVFSQELGILPGILQELWEAREETRKEGDELARYAIKILMNSFFGVLASPNCRFFSMEMANAITKTGQHITKKAAELISEKGFEVIYGDSVTAERPLVLLIDGVIEIISISELFSRYGQFAMTRGDKEVISLRGLGIRTLTKLPDSGESCFKPVNEIIRHFTQKKIFRVNQKYGETRCTEDHSLIVRENDSFVEIPPQELVGRAIDSVMKIPKVKEITSIDLYAYVRRYTHTSTYKDRAKLSRLHCDDEHIWFSWTQRKRPIKFRRFISFPSSEGDALLRLLGIYVAEGSSSTPETTASRWGASIASSDEVLLRQIQKDCDLLFDNATCGIVVPGGARTLNYSTQQGNVTVDYTDSTLKLQFMNQLSAVIFKELCGQKSSGKKIPSFVFHLPRKEKELFLQYYVMGDGHRDGTGKYSEEYVAKHFRASTKSLLLMSGLSLLTKQLGYAVSIRYHPSRKVYTLQTSSKNNTRLQTKVVEEEYSGYVYDLSVQDTHMFVDACGQLMLHNTDSIFVNLAAGSLEESERVGVQLASELNEFFSSYAKQRYGRESFLEMEYEKTFVRFLMPMTRSGEAAKKRYAGLRVKDGKEDVEFTGLEFVRRDWTDLSKEFQLGILERVFKKEDPQAFIRSFVEDLRAGKHDDLLVYRKALRKKLDDYTKTTPPHVKAARLLDEVTSDIIAYVMTVDGPEPVEKQQHSIDYEHYVEKQLKPIADSILVFYDTSFSDVLKGTKQKGLFEF